MHKRNCLHEAKEIKLDHDNHRLFFFYNRTYLFHFSSVSGTLSVLTDIIYWNLYLRSRKQNVWSRVESVSWLIMLWLLLTVIICLNLDIFVVFTFKSLFPCRSFVVITFSAVMSFTWSLTDITTRTFCWRWWIYKRSTER